MKTSHKIALIAAPLAIVSFVLSRVIWPDPVGMAGPDASLIPFFMIISALESIVFGLGVAFATLTWRKLRAGLEPDRLTLATYVAITWLLVSWWPHDNMHRVNGMENYIGLLRIEYIFHDTLILAGIVVALYFWRAISRTP